jgi:hypothetical protein
VPLSVDYTRGVVTKLDVGDLAVILANDYFERICHDSPLSRLVYDHA